MIIIVTKPVNGTYTFIPPFGLSLTAPKPNALLWTSVITLSDNILWYKKEHNTILISMQVLYCCLLSDIHPPTMYYMTHFVR